MKLELLVAILGLAACSESGWQSVVEVGRISYDGSQPAITAPSTAMVNVPAQVSVWTVGGGCITLESTDVVATGDGFAITPYDRRLIPGPDEGCTLELVPLDHSVDVTFASAGTVTLLVHVRDVAGQSDEMLDIPVSVAVQ